MPYCFLIGDDKMRTIARRRREFKHSATKATPANPAMPFKWKAPYVWRRKDEARLHLPPSQRKISVMM